MEGRNLLHRYSSEPTYSYVGEGKNPIKRTTSFVKKNKQHEWYQRAMKRLLEWQKEVLSSFDQHLKEIQKIMGFANKLTEMNSSYVPIIILQELRALMLKSDCQNKMEVDLRLQLFFSSLMDIATDFLVVALCERMRTLWLDIPEEEIHLMDNKDQSKRFHQFIGEQIIVARYVQFDVLSQKTSHAALLAVSMWAMVAKKCIDIGDWQSAMGVKIALDSKDIPQLRGKRVICINERVQLELEDIYLPPRVRFLLSQIDVGLGTTLQDMEGIHQHAPNNVIPHAAFYVGMREHQSEGFKLGGFVLTKKLIEHLKANKEIDTHSFLDNLCFSDPNFMQLPLFKKNDKGFEKSLSKMAKKIKPPSTEDERKKGIVFLSKCMRDPCLFDLLKEGQWLEKGVREKEKRALALRKKIAQLMEELKGFALHLQQLYMQSGADVLTPLTAVREKKNEYLSLEVELNALNSNLVFISTWRWKRKKIMEVKISQSSLWEKIKGGKHGSLDVLAIEKIESVTQQNERRASLPSEDSKSSYGTGRSFSREPSTLTESTTQSGETNNKELRRANSAYFYQEQERLGKRLKLMKSTSVPVGPVVKI